MSETSCSNQPHKKRKYCVNDAVDFKVMKRSLSVLEALRATKCPCTQQYLHKVCYDRPKMVSVITIEDDDADVSTLQTESSECSEKKGKKRRKSSKDKNTKRVLLKKRQDKELRIKNIALKSAFDLLDYTRAIKKRVTRNKKYIEQKLARDPNFVKPKGLREIVPHVNEKYGTDSLKEPLTRTTLMRYYTNNVKERKKAGAPPIIALVLLNTMRLYIKALQLSKNGQASGKLIKAKLTAAAAGTEHKGFDSDWAWRRIRELYPAEVAPSAVSQQESIRNKWTTYSKFNDWYDSNKKTLLDSGLAIDTPLDLLNRIVAEITIGEDEKRQIVNFNETNHSFSTVCHKGGSRSVRWGDSNLAKGTEKSTRGSRHTTGIYGSNVAGEVMPPVYCFDSSAENQENFQVKPSWVNGLPQVRGKYSCPTTETYEYFVSVRKSGCTDEQLMQQLIEDVYLLLYHNYKKDVERDENGNFIAGPIILKIDSGQGRLVATFSSIEFRERMQQCSVYLVLGLPNSTSYTQEQDQLYQEFKGKTRSMTDRVYSEKLTARSHLIKYLKEELTLLRDVGPRATSAIPREIDLRTKLKEAMKTPSLTKDDLLYIVCGKLSDSPSLSPFALTFIKEKIIKCFCRVGYVPFTRNCLTSENVRHELGEDTEDTTLEDLVQ